MIQINQLEAQKQATKIGQANDQLTCTATVTFSANTTVPGNQSAKASFQQLKASAPMLQQLLQRDVANIQCAVAAFQRADQQVKQLFNMPFKNGGRK